MHCSLYHVCVTSRQLLLVHEPEAAAVPVMSNVHQGVPLRVNESFIIVDAGGGTVDITCHKVQLDPIASFLLILSLRWFVRLQLPKRPWDLIL